MRFSNDPSEEMIYQEEWRRDRMHEAVDDLEEHGEGRCPNDHKISKQCLIDNCFAWCSEHHAISTEDDGEEVCTTYVTDRDRNGNIQHRVEHETKRRCQKRRLDPEQHERCDVVECDYSRDEWEQEEYDTWFNEAMGRD